MMTSEEHDALHEQVKQTLKRMKTAPRTSKLGRMRQRAKTKLSETYIEELTEEKQQELH